MQNVTNSTAPSAIVTENEGYGFFGTCQLNYGLSVRDAARLFDASARELIASGLVSSADAAREFLDSRYGRHFADALSFRVAMPCASVPHLAGAAASELADPKSRSNWSKSIKFLARA